MAADWPPARAYFGLHVDLGDFHTKRGIWLAYPTARFTCRWGCELDAVGPVDVANLTEHLTAHHARICPGPPTPAPGRT
ncbi:hypothetical protein OG866_26980 [Streptomyces sp. NBC_00663]|uniref:hypothetical protein n=1 Tax=Streptomyces sp. NBC_00663 TaxID=2975801 RepID=UPI002E34D8A8|nr:hypothetical protein [Streptomyces sp. NBC_00663]